MDDQFFVQSFRTGPSPFGPGAADERAQGKE